MNSDDRFIHIVLYLCSHFNKCEQNLIILTEEIYVRVYEDRMDLVRAVIIGPFGTPYQDGLFFFDFHLPPDYPDVPPVRPYFEATSIYYVEM